jgi:hypothetical protein
MEENLMKFARWIFLAAGVLGLLPALLVAYNLILNSRDLLPGSSGLGLFVYFVLIQYIGWQVFYILLSTDPLRYRSLMILAFFVELLTPVNSAWLYFFGFTPWVVLSILGFVFAGLFLAAHRLTARELVQQPA